MKFYGSLTNRLEENKNYAGKDIEVGMYATKYLWSDRAAYEVVEVVNQKNIFVRRLKAIRTDDNGMSECQDYRFESDTSRRPVELKKGKKGWYDVWRYTDRDGKERCQKHEDWNISFGVADEYYDYSF